MRLLLDTHAFLWAVSADSRLPRKTAEVLQAEGTICFVSVATVWEIAIKVGAGKLPGAQRLLDEFDSEMAILGADLLPISVAHAVRAGTMVCDHRDPFDRMLIAQALCDDLALVSNEKLFDRFGVQRIW